MGRGRLMAKPLIEIHWICRDCGCYITEPHHPGCRFAPKPPPEPEHVPSDPGARCN